MPRPLRINCPEVPYHILVRGNNKEPIFLNDNCYLRYLDLLSGYKKKNSFHLYSYCLMLNHIHLLLEPSQWTTVSEIMQALNTSYTVYVNKRFDRVGHLMQGRFKSILVEKESYLLRLTRYIHLNPVRAKIVARPEDYPWSSYRSYLGKNTRGLINKEVVVNLMGSDEAEQVSSYQEFVEEGLRCEEERIRIADSIKDRSILGSEEFAERILNKYERAKLT